MTRFRTRLTIGSFALGAAVGQGAMAAYLSPNFRATASAMSRASVIRTGKNTGTAIKGFRAAANAGYQAARLGVKAAPPTARFLGSGLGISAKIGGRIITSPVGRLARFGISKVVIPLAILGGIKGALQEGRKAQRSGGNFGNIYAQSFKGAVLGAIGLPSDVIFG